jgi:ABC-type lipoprotein export system ATPase subunit
MLVRIQDLQLRYGSGPATEDVLDIPGWSLEDGQQVAISGPSGSGKSTLLNLIAGLLAPTRGSVVVCGQDIALLGEAERDRFRARHIAYIFQTFNLLQGYTALENVLLGAAFTPRPADRSAARDLLHQVGLGTRLDHTPAEMSIGEQQRVAMARALIKEPRLILADEPTGSLDPRHASAVIRLLREASRAHGCGLLVVTHEARIAAAFEQRIDFLELNRALAARGDAP